MHIAENILQYEFFHVGGKGTFQEKFAEILRRYAETVSDAWNLAGSGVKPKNHLKTCIRIYDAGGVVTAWALEEKDLRRRRRDLLENKRIWFWGFRMYRIERRIKWLRKQMRNFAVQNLRRAQLSHAPVGVETAGHRYVLAQRDELLELEREAQKAPDFWLFVFEPNGLLSDTHESVVSLALV